jgi:hypothetical protein
MREREASREAFQLITKGGALGLACTSSEMIGHHGRLCWAARCAESREQVGGVGGWSSHVILHRFQRTSEGNGARLGGCGAPDGWVGAAL